VEFGLYRPAKKPVNAETMNPLWKNYATEISNEYAS